MFETEEAKAAGLVLLEEGTHHFKLANGALLTVYASPYTPSMIAGNWGFQYRAEQGQGHEWSIGAGIDVAITHGPPRGVLDYTDSKTRAGSEDLFAAVARARPRMHCFGHIHEGWGAKKITWRSVPSEAPSHFTDIDNDLSELIQNLSGIQARKFDTPEIINEKASKLKEYKEQGYCTATAPLQQGAQTLFVNAAIEGKDDESQQLPWIVDLVLPPFEKQETLLGTQATAGKKRKSPSDDSPLVD